MSSKSLLLSALSVQVKASMRFKVVAEIYVGFYVENSSSPNQLNAFIFLCPKPTHTLAAEVFESPACKCRLPHTARLQNAVDMSAS